VLQDRWHALRVAAPRLAGHIQDSHFFELLAWTERGFRSACRRSNVVGRWASVLALVASQSQQNVTPRKEHEIDRYGLAAVSGTCRYRLLAIEKAQRRVSAWAPSEIW
jgi:hypothetical protein